MIPSDHFVRFYNEVFKFLDEKNGLQAYYAEIGRHQELHCLDLFRTKGLRGVYEYYQKIYKEENCQGEAVLNDHEMIIRMDRCPSLSKALDNDAGACPKYCLHCPGWTSHIYTKAGLYQVYDLMGTDNPQCCEWIYDDKKLASAKYHELRRTTPADRLFINFEPEADIVDGKRE
ncbi:MAG: hypothetical protein IJS14_08525 [Lentisphaeria bacterium]|nr:hypothetical protein [Lentisphaeria bacterium]